MAGPTDLHRNLRLADGRRIAWGEFGSSSGRPVLALHGTPGSRLMFSIAGDSAARLGLRLIAPDRWGYGGTDVHPRPSFGAWASDVAEVVDHLALPRFSLIGISGGGPYAAATAALLGPRVERMALAVPIGPLSDGDKQRRLNLFHWLAYRGVGSRHTLTGAVFGLYRRLLMRGPQRAIRLLAFLQPRSDRELLHTATIQDFLSGTFRHGLQPGTAGPAIDLDLYARPWNIPLGAITASTHIWIGSDDRLVPLEAGRALARAVPHAALTELPGQGHFWIARDFEWVLSWLAGNA